MSAGKGMQTREHHGVPRNLGGLVVRRAEDVKLAQRFSLGFARGDRISPWSGLLVTEPLAVASGLKTQLTRLF